MVNTGRRARNRAARNRQITEAASTILAEGGLESLTMQEVADRVDCAVGTIYTYFSSKSALLAALQSEAIGTLHESHERAAARWEDYLEENLVEEKVAAMTRMLAISELVLSWKTIQPREFEFLQMLMANRQESMTDQDSLAAAPQALRLFAEARVALDLAVEVGAIGFDPDRPGDDGMSRTVRWMAALEGAVMVSNAFAGVEYLDPESFDMELIALRSVRDLLSAWGAEPGTIEAGAKHIEVLQGEGRLLPESI
jgi:AcrR family transcriptional regulator